jgi:hypothetical protein
MKNSRRVRWERYVAHTGEKTNSYSNLMVKPEGKTPLA